MLLGADPEMMAVDRYGNPQPICGLLGGTKESPIPVPMGAYQEDNVNPEFNIDPAHTEEQWVEHLTSVIKHVDTRLEPLQLKLAAVPSFHYTPETLESLGSAAMSFGCNPDRNVWTGDWNRSPNPYTTLRSAGGHIHFSCREDEVDSIVKLMDIYLGIPSVLLDPDKSRREAYGKAGSFRYKPYGGEYRTLSNFWVGEERLMRWAYRMSQKAYKDLAHLPELVARITPYTIQQCINTADVESAKDIVTDLDLDIPSYMRNI